MTLDEYLISRQRCIDKALERVVPSEHIEPGVIHRAMRYSLFAGGKRIRPILCIAASDAVSDGAPASRMPPARSSCCTLIR